MLWSTLFHKIGKQQMHYTQHNHVYALLTNPKTHQMEKIYLDLKYDANGHPYLVQSQRNDRYNNPKPHKQKRKG